MEMRTLGQNGQDSLYGHYFDPLVDLDEPSHPDDHALGKLRLFDLDGFLSSKRHESIADAKWLIELPGAT